MSTPDFNPFQAPEVSEFAADQPLDREYGGIGRLQYFGFTFGIEVVINIIQYFLASAGFGIGVIFTMILGLVVTIVLAVQRLKNLGYNGWWVVGMIVPILNILVGLRCLAAPEGYADHKTLDTAGKIIIGVCLGAIALVVGVVILNA